MILVLGDASMRARNPGLLARVSIQSEQSYRILPLRRTAIL
jgi:hypothetical protein